MHWSKQRPISENEPQGNENFGASRGLTSSPGPSGHIWLVAPAPANVNLGHVPSSRTAPLLGVCALREAGPGQGGVEGTEAPRAAEGAVPCRSGSNPQLTRSHLLRGWQETVTQHPSGPRCLALGDLPYWTRPVFQLLEAPCCRGFGGGGSLGDAWEPPTQCWLLDFLPPLDSQAPFSCFLPILGRPFSDSLQFPCCTPEPSAEGRGHPCGLQSDVRTWFSSLILPASLSSHHLRSASSHHRGRGSLSPGHRATKWLDTPPDPSTHGRVVLMGNKACEHRWDRPPPRENHCTDHGWGRDGYRVWCGQLGSSLPGPQLFLPFLMLKHSVQAGPTPKHLLPSGWSEPRLSSPALALCWKLPSAHPLARKPKRQRLSQLLCIPLALILLDSWKARLSLERMPTSSPWRAQHPA